MLLFALWSGPISSWGIGDIACALLVIAGIVAVFLIASKQLGFTLPPWVIQILWVLAVVFVGILAIKFLMSM